MEYPYVTVLLNTIDTSVHVFTFSTEKNTCWSDISKSEAKSDYHDINFLNTLWNPNKYT